MKRGCIRCIVREGKHVECVPGRRFCSDCVEKLERELEEYGGYVCQQCRVHRYPDCGYAFHPEPPEGVPDRWRESAEQAGR